MSARSTSSGTNAHWHEPFWRTHSKPLPHSSPPTAASTMPPIEGLRPEPASDPLDLGIGLGIGLAPVENEGENLIRGAQHDSAKS